MRGVWLSLLCVGCLKSQTVQCEDRVCPADSACDTIHHGCVAPDQLKTCVGLAEGLDCVIAPSGAGFCRDQVCLPADCGDGFQRSDELCDGEELGLKANCTDHGFYDSKAVACNSACNYDTTMCTGSCGDGMLNGPELCDGAPPTLACTDLGYGGGFLDCNQCGPDVDGCRLFGWRTEYVVSVGLSDVHGTSDTNIFVVGDAGTMLEFDPLGWKDVDTSACSNEDLIGVWAFGPHDAIAIGNGTSGSVAVRVTPMGCVVSTIDTAPVTDIWASGPNDIYVAGNGIHHFDGTSWSTSNAGTTFRALWGASVGDIYAGANGGLLLHWNGATWSPSSVSPVAGPLTKITGLSSSDVWIQGYEGNGNTRLLRYNGATWSDATNATTYGANALTATRGHVFSWGPNDVIAYDGTDWANLGQITTVGGGLRSLWGSPKGRVLAVSVAGTILSYAGGVTTDQSPYGGPPLSLAVGREQHAAFNFSGGPAYVWSGNGLLVDSNIPSGSVLWFDPADNDLYAQTSTGLYRRAAGASTFSSSAEVAVANGNSVFGTSATDLWIIAGPGNDQLRHWDGSQETCLTCSVPSRIVAAWARTTSDAYVVGPAGMIAHWNGSVWTGIAPTTEDLWGVAGAGTSDVYAVGRRGTVLHFNGTTWNAVDAGTGVDLFAVWAFAPDDVFVAGAAGVIRHFDGTHWAPVRSPTGQLIYLMAGAGDSLYMLDEYGRFIRIVRTIDW